MHACSRYLLLVVLFFSAMQLPAQVTVKKNIEYCSIGNRKLSLDIYQPGNSKYLPAIMIIHGGGWRTGNKKDHREMAEKLAALGYVCILPEYRLSGEALYPAAVHDVKSALRWIHLQAGKYNIDTNRIAVAGFSAGGQLAALLGTTMHSNLFDDPSCNKERSARLQAVVDMDGILAFIHPESGEGNDKGKKLSAATSWFGVSKEENPGLWKQASALTHVNESAPPFLILNSSVDRMHAGRNYLVKILDMHCIYNEVKTFNGAPHSFPLEQPWFDSTISIMHAFLQKVFDKPLTGKTMIVAKDGSGDFTKVQSALDAIPLNNRQPITVYIRNGIYKEKLHLDSSKNHVTLLGEDVFKTILSYDDHSGRVTANGDTINTYTSYSFLEGADDFTAHNISFENPAGFTAGQAVAMHITGDRVRFFNCRFTGNQDVLFMSRAATRQYFENCYIEGTTDFIFGPSTAWFEKNHIHSKKNSHVTAASTPKEQEFGYVFNQCVLTGDTSLKNVSLGRPWRPYAHVIYMHSYIGSHIKKEGWSNWNQTDNYRYARYAEYKNFGPGAGPAGRISWTKQLNDEQARKITLRIVMDGWDPKKKP